MKVRNRTTNRFYMGTASRTGAPIWSAPHRPSQALELSLADAQRAVRQLTYVEPSLDLQIVGADRGEPEA